MGKTVADAIEAVDGIDGWLSEGQVRRLFDAAGRVPDGGRIVVAARAEGELVAISVMDNGRGVPPEDVPRLFDKFHRGRAFAAAAPQSGNPDEVDVSGVGLGLYLARNVMEQMGGRIGVETELGRGSTFTLYLQVWDADRCGAAVEEERQNAGTIVGS